MPISITKDQARQLIVLTAAGVVEFDEIRSVMKEYYLSGEPIKNVLWDFSNASLKKISSDEVDTIARFARDVGKGKRAVGDKTALVTPKDLEFGVLRQIDTFLEMKKISISVKVFRSLDQANQWLEKDE